MSAPRPRLRTLVGWTFALLASLAIGAAAALLSIARYEQETASYLVVSVQSVLTAERIEAEIKELQAAAIPVAGEVEQALLFNVGEARRMIQSPAESQVVLELEQSVQALLAARQARATRSGAAEEDAVKRAVEAALPRYEALLDINLEQAAQVERSAIERGQRARAWGIAAACAVVAAMLGLLLWARLRLVRPLEQLQLSIHQLAQGETGVRASASEDAPAELREAATTFNAMARLIDEQQQGRIEFLGRLGESLVAPLQSLRGTLDQLALRSPAPEPAEQRTLSTLLVQARSLERMVGEFLDAARLEEGRLPLTPERFDLREAVREAVEFFRGLLVTHHFELRMPEVPVVVHADASRMAQAINNLIGLALRRSPSGSQLEVELAIESGEAVLRAAVRDSGTVGFEALFNALQGLDDLLRGVPGAVFGLHASRRLIDAHGGKMELTAGPAVQIRLPLLDEAPPSAILATQIPARRQGGAAGRRPVRQQTR